MIIYQDRERINDWHNWFAWRPVFANTGKIGIVSIVWLQTIQRRADDGLMHGREWEYRLIK